MLAHLLELAQDIDSDALDEALPDEGLSGWDWGRAGLILLGAVLVGALLRRLVVRVLARAGAEGLVADFLGALTSYLIGAAGVIYALSSLGVQVGPLFAALGIIGIALAFALKDILENFMAGLLLQVRRPFRKGDQIITGDHEGTVREVNARTVVIDQPDGTRVMLPSSKLITGPIVNLTHQPLRRTTLEVGVHYRTDLRRAKAAIEAAVGALEVVADDPPLETRLVSFDDSAITIAVRFWHGATIAEMWSARDEVALAVKDGLDEAGIEIPFPQRVVTFPTAG